MAISVKSKFAGFLRGLIGRADNRAPARPVAPTAPVPAPAPAKTSTPSRPAQAATPAAALPAKSCGSRADEIEVPLASVVASLPLDLRAKLMAPPPAGQTIHLQAEMVIGQLAFGAVKISFGELRQLAPGIFVNSGGELDNKLVSLPLQEILPRLNPALLARRAAKKIEVADEIVGPFADRGRGFTFTTQPLKAPAAQPVPPPEPKPEPSAPITFTPPAPRQVAPPNASHFPTRSITPAAPASTTNGHSHPPITPLSARSVTPANGHGANGHGSGHANGAGSKPALPPGLRLGSLNGNGNGNVRAEMPAPMKMAPSTATEPPAPNAAPAPATIFAVLGTLCEHWPGDIKDEVNRASLAQVNLPLEGSVILPGLKRGRVVMTWKQIRLLAQPSSSPSPNDSVELELPLKVLAPLFLAAQKNAPRTQTKASVSADIPDLFFGFPQPAAPPAIVAPVIPPLPRPVENKPEEIKSEIKPLEMRLAEPKPQDTNFYVADEAVLRRSDVPQTDFMNRQAHPKDVVSRAATIPGVAGAVVAMQDGLRVASQIPAELSADTLAAFLPQIFERVNQSTRELRMGTLNNVSFTVGNVPWKIFRVNAVYFAAFGRAGEQLPTTQLAQLAAELDRKKQQ